MEQLAFPKKTIIFAGNKNSGKSTLLLCCMGIKFLPCRSTRRPIIMEVTALHTVVPFIKIIDGKFSRRYTLTNQQEFSEIIQCIE